MLALEADWIDQLIVITGGLGHSGATHRRAPVG